MSDLYFPSLRSWLSPYHNDFNGKWGCRWYPDRLDLSDEEREALTCDSGAFAADRETAINYAKGQIRKQHAAEYERQGHHENSSSGVRTRYRLVAPWGDTYNADDMENGCVPLEAYWIEEQVEE